LASNLRMRDCGSAALGRFSSPSPEPQAGRSLLPIVWRLATLLGREVPVAEFNRRPEGNSPAMDEVLRRRRLGSVGEFAVGVIIGAALSCVLASAAPVSRHDGSFWNRLGKQEKAAYVAGYSDAARTSLGKLDSLKLAAAAFHWKGAKRVLSQLAREVDVSGLEANDLTAYLDGVYSNPRYRDFHVAIAIELAALRGTDLKPVSGGPPAASTASDVKR
jgi:hypothetical protein